MNNYPKLHNAMWPGLVGKGSPGAEPWIDLDTLLDLTVQAEVGGIKFDGVDLFLSAPHISIDLSNDGVKTLAEKIGGKGLQIGSVVAPIWPPAGGGSAMGDDSDRKKYVEQVRKSCRIARLLRELGIRPHGVVRIDTACSVSDWEKDPQGNTRRIIQTLTEAAEVAKGHGESLALEGEICWGGLHSWKHSLELLEGVGQPDVLGFQADMAHTLLFMLGYNAPRHRLVPENFNWEPEPFQAGLKAMTRALRPWTLDFHVAQNDATVKGSGTHDKTGRHCPATDPNGKLNIARDAGYWLRDDDGQVTKKIKSICWDGCMFPNDLMLKPETWNNVLAAMIQVRENHGWQA